MFATVLSDDAKDALAALGKSGLVDRGYLAGGSALALHFGHRYSFDFDFFSPEPFDPRVLSKNLQKIGPFEETVAKGISLLGTFHTIKFSYFGYQYPMIAPFTRFLNVSIAHPHDIAAMKLVALMDRGTRRDFIDLYEFTSQGISLDKMFDFYQKKYGKLEQNVYSLVKALGYFQDAEPDIMPQMITPLSWEECKTFFAAESVRLGKKYLEE